MGERTVTCGVMGAGAGCGVTHFTLLFANHLTAIEGKKTAVLEWGRCHAIGALCAVCTGRDIMTDRLGAEPVPVTILDVDHFPDGGARELAWCQKEGYDYILLDLGRVQEADKGAFLQCGQRFFLGALNEWRLEELLGWKDLMLSGKGRWTYLAAFGSEGARREIWRRYRISFGQIPYAPDVFTIDRETAVFFKRLRKGKG